MATSASAPPLTLNRRLQLISGHVDAGIARIFRRWGKIVSKWPYTTIFVTVAFTVLWTVAFILQFQIELDSDDLFTPRGAESFDDQKYVESVFTESDERAQIICVHRKSYGHDCRQKLMPDVETARSTVQEYLRFYRHFEAMTSEYDGVTYNLSTICTRPSPDSDCQATSILDVWKYDDEVIMATDFNPLTALNGDDLTDRFGKDFYLASYMADGYNEECNAEDVPDDMVVTFNTEALSMTVMYQFDREDVDGAEIDPESVEWIGELMDFVRDFSDDSFLDFYLADGNAVFKELRDTVLQESVYFVGGFVLILIFALTVLFKNSCLACKAHLTIVALLGICFSISSGFGIVQSCGQKFNNLVLVLPFLILGLGIDNTFVIIGAFQRIDYRLSVEDRIVKTLERAGSTIFVTSSTSVFAFLTGIFTVIPVLKAFGFYAATAVFCTFLYQVTFFVAFLVLDARREQRYREGAPMYGLQKSNEPVAPAAPATSAPPPQQISNNDDASNALAELLIRDTPGNAGRDHPNVWRKMCGTGVYDPQQLSFSTRIAGEYLPKITLTPIGRWGVLVAEVLILAAFLYGCFNVEMDFISVQKVLREGSDLETAFSLQQDYFLGKQIHFSIYTKETSESYFYYQGELRQLKERVDDNKWIAPPGTSSWYAAYSKWLSNSGKPELINGTAPDEEHFFSWLQEFLEGDGSFFKQHIVFDANDPKKIISSRFTASTVDIDSGAHAVDMLDSIRDTVAEAAPRLDPVPYCFNFLFFDGYAVLLWETTRNIIMAGIAVFLINCIVLASVRTAFFVLLMVGFTDTILFGFVYFIGMNVDTVSAITMILSVGISVDYSAHIAHSFLVVRGSLVERAQGALEHIGGEVLAGAFSTFLGIVCLVFCHYYSYDVFLKMIFAIVVSGTWHGLVFLPVLMSFFGAEPYITDLSEVSGSANDGLADGNEVL